MKFGRHQINKAGKRIISNKEDKAYESELQKINEWRTLHLVALDDLQQEILSILETNNIKIFLTSSRLKRLSSIILKLMINPNMGLGGMQDIGGLRIIVEDIKSLERVKNILEVHIPPSFQKEKMRDYVETPKDSGYRSIHIIYKYISENLDTDGAIIELQVRTKLQHSWAMAVETAGLITSTSLKSSIGAEEWLDFFKVVSSLFAIKEKKPILRSHAEKGFDMFDLMKILYKSNIEFNHNNTLKALNVTISQAQKNHYKDGYYILNINFKTRFVTIIPFSKEEENEAFEKYSEEEKCSCDKQNAVVLVSVPKMKELKEAYPSYFLNTKEFLSAIDTMMKNCKIFNIV